MIWKPNLKKLNKVLEKDIEGPVCQYARDLGWLAHKFTSPARRSVPDRIFLGPGGSVFFIEFKAPGKRVTEKQGMEIDKLQALGHRVWIADSIAEGKKIVVEENRRFNKR